MQIIFFTWLRNIFISLLFIGIILLVKAPHMLTLLIGDVILMTMLIILFGITWLIIQIVKDCYAKIMGGKTTELMRSIVSMILLGVLVCSMAVLIMVGLRLTW